MGKFVVVGTILDAKNNRKLEDALITTDGTNNFTKSVANGYYEIEFDSDKDNGLTVEKNGYFPITKRVVKQKGDLTVIDILIDKEPTTKAEKIAAIDNVLSDLEKQKNQKGGTPSLTKQTQYAPITAGGISAVALGGVAYLMSRKFLDNKWGQLAVTATSAVVFYFVGFNVTQIIQSKKNSK